MTEPSVDAVRATATARGRRDAQDLAKRAAATMWRDDAASRWLGMRLVEVAPGRAVVAMTVREEMANGHGICHGGFIFTLADSAFAFACNSYNRRTVAQGCDIVFVAPAKTGHELTATALERLRTGRNGLYDVTVRTADQVIAEFRGRSREIGGAVTDETPPAGERE
jgi:phenylacetic acid degradation protein PaaD